MKDLSTIFAADWSRAGNDPTQSQVTRSDAWMTTGRDYAPAPTAILVAPPKLMLVASPQDMLPPGIRFELTEIQALLASAATSIRIQLLEYLAGEWTEIEEVLVQAAKRGIRVELLLADWCKHDKFISGIQQLARTPNVEVRFVTFPQHSTGFIKFARVAHAKLLVVDRERAWIGSSNWEREYFYTNRNVGLVINDRAIAERIAIWSDATWTSSYATRVDPDAKYTAPRIK